MLVRPLMRFAPLAPSFRDKSRQGENDVRRGLRNPWNQVIRATVLLSAALLFGAACDDDDNDADGNICAEGTVEVDGECVLDTRVCGPGTELRGTRCEATGGGGGDELECGAGTVEVSGECVPSSTVECGPGTTLNTDGECIPDALIECGPGTVEADGQCVPDSTSSACGDGTVLDEASGECVPDLGLICGAGTVAVDGECVDTLEALRRMTSIPEGNEPNDPSLGGAARAVPLAPAGDSVLLKGTIGAVDPVDGPDWDAWSITSTVPGQVIRVTGISAGLPAPWFALVGDLDGDGVYDYQRTSPTNEDTQPWRDFVLPVPGEYLLFVTDRLNASGGSSGSPTYEYYTIVETLPPLTAAGATSVTVGTAPITVAPGSQKPVHDNVFHITPSAGADELVVFDRPVFDNAYAFQSLLLFDPSDMSFAGIESFTFCIEDIFFGTQCYLRGPFGREVSASGLVAVLDADSINGFGEFGATVTLEAAPTLSSNAQGTLDNGGLDIYVADLPAGTLLEVQIEGEANVQPLVQLLGADGQALTLAQDDDYDGIVTARWYFDTDSRVQVLVGDGAFEDPTGTSYGYTLAADMIPVASLGQLHINAPTASLNNIALDSASNDSTWLAFEVNPAGPASAELTVNSIAEVGFELYLQSGGQFTTVGGAFPSNGEASGQIAIPAPGWILAQLVALSGADSAIEATATLSELPVYSGDGNTCQTAIALAGSGSFVVDLPAYTSTLTSTAFGDCGGITGSARSGQDSFYLVNVPDGMTLSVDVTGTGNGDDPLIALLENSPTLCSSLGVDSSAFTCLAYNDDRDPSNWNFAPFTSWTNDTGSTVEVMVVVDNWFTSVTAGDHNLVTITIAP